MRKKENMTFENFLRSNKGGIATVIATVATIVLTLSAIGYSVFSQVSGTKDTGDKAQIEQGKIGQMVQDANTVTGSIVKNYITQAISAGSSISVQYTNTGGTQSTISTGGVMPSNINDGALYKMTKAYDSNGNMSVVTFVQVDLKK